MYRNFFPYVHYQPHIPTCTHQHNSYNHNHPSCTHHHPSCTNHYNSYTHQHPSSTHHHPHALITTPHKLISIPHIIIITGAHFNLALCYEHGVGLPKDEKEAIKIYRMLAEKYDYSLAAKALTRLQIV